MSEGGRPYPKNVSGPFYVEDGWCVTCGVMHDVAPTLFAWDDEEANTSHCFVHRQPTDSTEITHMLSAMLDSEMDCVRYRGDDPNVIRRIVEAGLSTQLDVPRPPHLHPLVRNCVAFDDRPGGKPQSAGDIAGLFEVYLHGQAAEWRRRDEEYEARMQQLGIREHGDSRPGYRFTSLNIERHNASFSYAWSDDFHTVSVSELKEPETGWLMRHSTPVSWSGISVSRQIHAWFTTADRFENIRWYSDEQWRARKDWQSTPI